MTAILDILFPPKCAFCGKLLENSGSICDFCRDSLPLRAENSLTMIGENQYPAAIAFYYDSPVKEGVKAFKFGRKSWRSKPFARYIAQTAAEWLGGSFDTITFVPVSWRRNFERGFDQSRLLAEQTAKLWDARAVPTLRKIRHNSRQSTLTSAALRRQNASGVYAVPHPERVRGKKLLLIDDICTTGSTLASAAGALMEAGAASVVCAALAGGHKKV